MGDFRNAPDKTEQALGGFPRSLPEDSVEYTIYVIDGTLDDSAVRGKLREVQNAASALVQQHLKGFIWQRQSFQLNIVRENGLSLLRGQTNFGDSLDDEWLIVYLLRELSKQFDFIWIRIADSDGQFLLIEAANVLPLWLDPEVSDFRVWINNGRLLIIPVESPGGKHRRSKVDLDILDLDQALLLIKNSKTKLLHSSKIEDEAFYRLQKYPERISESLHHALVKVPRKLAYVLKENPAYVSPAVEAFYLRDPIALRPLQSQSIEGLKFPPIDLVTMSTKFTKIGFAQVVGQNFAPPTSWKNVSAARGNARAKQYADLGMKVTCGFEMFLQDPQNKDNKVAREISMLLEDLRTGEAQLPNDNDVREWGMREDDQGWLDINYADFEKELEGNVKSGMRGGFGDSSTQDHLRKIVSRLGDLLKDETASGEQADFLDDLDDDSDYEGGEYADSEDGDNDDSGSDSDPIHGKDEFSEMMQEMMGMPPAVMSELMGTKRTQDSRHSITKPATSGQGLETDNPKEFWKGVTKEGVLSAMNEMEQELQDVGALDRRSDNDTTEDLP